MSRACVSAGFIVPALPTDAAQEGRASGAVDLRAVVSHALATIDRVHGDGVLPTIAVADSYSSAVPSAGGFVSRKGVPVSIDVNTHEDFAPSAMLTFIHETGHFLDLSALGEAGAFATLAGDVTLDGWRAAVDATNAVHTLRQRMGAGAVEIQTSQGAVAVAVGDRHVEYLLGYDELWARSYAQFIAERSMDATLLAALDLTRPPATIGQLYPAQWSTADFAPVARAIDTLFRGLGWIS